MSSGFHVGTFFIFLAFVMLLFVSVSSPVWDEVAFLKVRIASNPTQWIAFGNWGYCILRAGPNLCSGTSVGYNIMGVLRDLDGVNVSASTANDVHNLSRALILHPIACALAFFSIIAALASHRIGSLYACLLATLVTALTLAAMIIDWVNFDRVLSSVNGRNGPGFGASFASAIWLVTTSFIVLTVGTLVVWCGFAERRRRTRTVGGGSF